MKVLMFGWEFPPFKSGGLGTACYDLTKGLAKQGHDVSFVMPFVPEKASSEFVNVVGANNYAKNIKIRKINSILTPYMTSDSYVEESDAKLHIGTGSSPKEVYGKNLYHEVFRFSEAAREIAVEEDHEVIHAHDWMTYQAGINARKNSKKPLVVHIHATESDRTGGNPNPHIAEIEYNGLIESDLIIANSNYTKDNVMREYGISEDKIEVVHWGIDEDNPHYSMNFSSPIKKKDKVVLFLGRVTIQKGPEYFLHAARLVSDHIKDVKFVFAGSGDMLQRMIDLSVDLGISEKMIFTGFLKGADVHKAFQMADLYVMPSVSEPFGLVALESIKNNTPLIISKQSGVSEVLNHALKVDFWDVDEMANKIINILNYPELHGELKENSFREAQRFNLDTPAQKCVDCYKKALDKEVIL